MDAAAFRQIRRDALNADAEELGAEPAWMEESLLVLADWFKTKWSGQIGFFVGAFDPALVGIIFCAREAKLSALYVMPQHRQRGIGRRLLLDAVARAKEWFDPERIWLDVAATNARARKLYLSCGFCVIGPDGLEDEDRMELDLR